MTDGNPSRDDGKTLDPIHLEGAVWMKVGDQSLGGHGRIGLLRAIAELGSISQAARSIGMSYKTAWDAVDTMNNLAGEPLVVRSTGGRGGGSTLLTERGMQLIQRFLQVEATHKRFVKMLSDEAIDLSAELQLLRNMNMKTSARNHFSGTISAIRPGAVNDEVELTLYQDTHIVAIITHESTVELGLEVGSQAFALVPAAFVIIATDIEGARISTRNQLRGTVVRLTPGAINSEVVLELDGGGNIAAMLTNTSVAELELAEGKTAYALFKAPNVILGTLA